MVSLNFNENKNCKLKTIENPRYMFNISLYKKIATQQQQQKTKKKNCLNKNTNTKKNIKLN